MRRSSLFPRSSFLFLLRPSRGTYVDGVVCPCPLPIPEARQGKARRGAEIVLALETMDSFRPFLGLALLCNWARVRWMRDVFPPEASSVGNYS